jgi:lipopolysaccharide/colanic/teichoic acid biosynthesis glycosyltransferase
MQVLSRKKTRRKRHVRDVPVDWEIQPANDLIPGPYFRWKRIIDRVLAAILLIPGLPIIGSLVLLVRLTSRGPGIFGQTRVGKDGRTFTMYKLRTMVCDAEARTGPVWAYGSDPRVTPLGRLLRKWHLDEFPQLFNVLKREMALVGPRPERPEFVEVLAKRIPGYVNRLTVPPGVTGPAQIHLPPDTDLDSVRQKLVLDLEYVRHAGVLLDTRIVLYTGLRLLKVPSGPLTYLLRLEGKLDRIGRVTAGGNGADSSPATPASIAVRAMHSHTGGDGKDGKDGRPKAKDQHAAQD